jgi:phage terminase Nu1 subunit (DNA packaging protein)
MAGVDQSELSRLMGVTREAVRLWTVEGCPRRDDGSYIVAEVVTWRIARAVQTERNKRREGDKPKQHASEANRKLAAEADLKELQLEQLRGNLVPIEVFDAKLGSIVGGFQAVASGGLARFEREIVQAITPAQARRLTERIFDSLMEGARGLGAQLGGEDPDDDAVHTEDAA